MESDGSSLQPLQTLICLLSSRLDHAQEKLSRLYHFGRNVGLKTNTEKNKVFRLNTARPDPLKIGQREVEDMESFVYLGAKVNKQGGAGSEIKA